MYLSTMRASSFDYELIDFGDGRKLERFGKIVLDRPEILAQGPKKLSPADWNNAAGYFSETGKTKGVWKTKKPLPENWMCLFEHSNTEWQALLKTGDFKHVGIFPEQEAHWRFISDNITDGDNFLNLFGYTGCASITAAKAGGDVYHVDSSKSVINWASNNADFNGIENIHWVREDALKFAKREVKRGRKYKGIIMDPPIYGRGAKGEHWKLENLLPELMSTAAKLLDRKGFLILNTYSPAVGISDMENLCRNLELKGIKSGWLSVNTISGRKLELSKYIIAEKRA